MFAAIPHLAAFAPPPGFEALPQLAVTVGVALVAFVLGRMSAGREDTIDVESQRELWMARVYRAETREREALQNLHDGEERWKGTAPADELDAAPTPAKRLRQVAAHAADAAVEGLREMVLPRPSVEAEPEVLAEPEPLGGPFAEDLTIDSPARWELEDDFEPARPPVESLESQPSLPSLPTPALASVGPEDAPADDAAEDESAVAEQADSSVEPPRPAPETRASSPITTPLVPLG